MTKNCSLVVYDKKKDETVCQNCETTFVGNYCPQCGQSKLDYDRPFRFIIADFAGNMFAFDTRLWTSLKTILFRPGQLALDYISGKRIRYMPPLRLYLFISFLYMLQLNYMASDTSDKYEFFDVDMTMNDDEAMLVDSLLSDANDSIREVIDLEMMDLPQMDMVRAITQTQTETLSHALSTDSLKASKDDKLHALSDTIKAYTDFTLFGRQFTYDIADISTHRSFYIEKVFKYYSWTMLALMPFLGFLFWLFYRKQQANYTSHLILAINIVTINVILSMISLTLFYCLNDGEGIVLLARSALYISYILIGSMTLYGTSLKTTIKRSIPIGILYSLSMLVFVCLIVIFAFSLT